jgi:NAD-dependent dihydropyrimidine dehydrogenase PreA subunit
MTEPRYLTDVVTLELNQDKCVGCGLCRIVCPHGVFAVEDGRAKIIDRDACMECGACARNCPVEAIEVKAGVGCASGIIKGTLRGTEPTCDCSPGPGKSCS